MKLSELILLILIAVAAYKLLYAIVKRTTCVMRINSLRRECGATVLYNTLTVKVNIKVIFMKANALKI